MNSVYFDHAATTPVDQRVLQAMLPWFTQMYGNPNSAHQFGRDAKVAIEDARESIAERIGAEPQVAKRSRVQREAATRNSSRLSSE